MFVCVCVFLIGASATIMSCAIDKNLAFYMVLPKFVDVVTSAIKYISFDCRLVLNFGP